MTPYASPYVHFPYTTLFRSVYDVMVTAIDSGFPALFSTQSITVTVTPVEDNDPVITSNGGGEQRWSRLVKYSNIMTTDAATYADKTADILRLSCTTDDGF